MIDTHSHLYSPKFNADMGDVVARAQEVLSHVFLPNIDLESIPQMLELTARAPQFFFPMMGLHPSYVKEDYKAVLKKIEAEWDKRDYFGVGETGLDYYWDTTFVAEQKDSLRLHIQWAKEKQLPLILHCRDSMEDVIELVREGQDGRLRGIFHCFTGSREQAARIQDLGFVMGIGGVLTYKNSQLGTVLADIPMEHLVLETDAPYLPPVPFRGKRNESSYIPHVARKLAEIKELPIAEVGRITTENALRVFGIPSLAK